MTQVTVRAGHAGSGARHAALWADHACSWIDLSHAALRIHSSCGPSVRACMRIAPRLGAESPSCGGTSGDRGELIVPDEVIPTTGVSRESGDRQASSRSARLHDHAALERSSQRSGSMRLVGSDRFCVTPV
jgi:hypothetical protein